MSKTERRKLSGDRNQCPGCGEFFNSVYAFDAHRTGPFSARRCLSVDDMRTKGMVKNAADYWTSRALTPDERKRVIPEACA